MPSLSNNPELENLFVIILILPIRYYLFDDLAAHSLFLFKKMLFKINTYFME